jgi:hypothetical protein
LKDPKRAEEILKRFWRDKIAIPKTTPKRSARSGGAGSEALKGLNLWGKWVKTPLPSFCAPLGVSYRQLRPEAHFVGVGTVSKCRRMA